MSKFPWLKHYPQGVPAEIEMDVYPSVVHMLENSFAEHRDKPAFENMGKGITYGELDDLSKSFAAYLQIDLGLKKGDRIAIQMPNLLQYPVVLVGAMRAGLIVVNTNPLYTAREMEHQFNDAEVKAVVILANFASNLEKIQGKTKIEHIIVTKLGDMLGGLKGGIVNFVVKYIKKMVPAYNLPTAIAFKNALSKRKPSEFKPVEIGLDDTAFLQYTGGTTGVSKGANLTHSNIVNHNTMVHNWFIPIRDVNKPEVVITAIPLYHIFALTVNGIFFMSIGGKNVLITNPRDMPGFVKELAKHRYTLITGVNTLFNGLLNNPDFSKLDFSSLKGAVGGGMAVQDVVANRWKEVTGTDLSDGFGLSETSPLLSCNPLDGTQRRGSIGLPVSSTEMAIFDEDGKKQLPPGEIGEICGRGPQVMKGYWNKDNSGVFLEGGWFKTGDMGFMDEDGFFKIVDRKKDMILVSGFNVYPNEIENVFADHPKVLEVAAVGVPDDHSTEAVKIFVVKKDPSLTMEELLEYGKENLTGYKRPKHVEFREELPKTNVGKILRRKLKED